MRIAAISDIHANLPAFEAVLNHLDALAPDVVVVGGDVINRGAQPLEVLDSVLDRVRHHGWRILKGNHEDYVLKASRGTAHLAAWEREVCAHTLWTARRIADRLPEIAAWPDMLEVKAPDGSSLACYHASKTGNRAGLYRFMEDHEIESHLDSAGSAWCVGHTHVPFIRRVRDRLVVNAGAVGMPFDGIPDASMALVEWTPAGWEAEIIRIPYDRALTMEAFHRTGYIRDGGLMVRLIVHELETASPMLGKWHVRYEKSLASGAMTLAESVELMLEKPD